MLNLEPICWHHDHQPARVQRPSLFYLEIICPGSPLPEGSCSGSRPRTCQPLSSAACTELMPALAATCPRQPSFPTGPGQQGELSWAAHRAVERNGLRVTGTWVHTRTTEGQWAEEQLAADARHAQGHQEPRHRRISETRGATSAGQSPEPTVTAAACGRPPPSTPGPAPSSPETLGHSEGSQGTHCTPAHSWDSLSITRGDVITSGLGTEKKLGVHLWTWTLHPTRQLEGAMTHLGTLPVAPARPSKVGMVPTSWPSAETLWHP